MKLIPLLLALGLAGCGLRAPLVTPGQTIYVILAYVQTAEGVRAIGEPFVVEAVLEDGYIRGHNPGAPDDPWHVNMHAVIQFKGSPELPHPPSIGWDDEVREQVRR